MTSVSGISGRYRDAFSAPEFRAIFGAYVVSMLGYFVASLALTVLVYRQTASSLLSALTFTMAFVPFLFGGTVLSGLVDRLPPRRLLVCCDLVSAAAVAVMTLPGLPVALLFALLFAMSLLTPVSNGCRGALLPVMLPQGAVVPGRSLLRMVAQGSQIAGFAVGGALLGGLSPRGVLGVEVLTFTASALVLRVFLRPRPAMRVVGVPLARDSLRGVRKVLREPALRRLLLFGWLVPFLSVAPEALAAPSVAARGLPSQAAGWWLTAAPLGTVVGELAGIWLIPVRLRGRLVAPLAACGFATLLGFAVHPPFAAALALLCVFGLSAAYVLGLDQLLLDATPPALLGRAYAVSTAGLMSTQGLGFAAAGVLGEILPPDTSIALAAAGGLAVVAALRFRPRRCHRGPVLWKT